MYVFAYGSLLSRASLSRTLPEVSSAQCTPARLGGYERAFDVAFPNDGSQPDKIYRRPGGTDPAVVLLANIRATRGRVAVNGVLIPVQRATLERLHLRELRYDLVDVTAGVHVYTPWRQGHGQVVAFTGRSEFIQPSSAQDGLVPREYLTTILDGVEDWERRCPGFGRDFDASTRAPARSRVAALDRIDLWA